LALPTAPIGALLQGLFHITDVVQPEEYTSIIESLQSRDGQKNLRKASRKVRHGLSLQDPDVVDTIAERISTHPFFDNCDYYKQKRRLQGAGHCSAPHQDHTDEFTPPYKYRVVLRFSADGVSPSDINFHTEDTLGPGSKRSASLEIASGQVCVANQGKAVCCVLLTDCSSGWWLPVA
jgi:hypothetical protein